MGEKNEYRMTRTWRLFVFHCQTMTRMYDARHHVIHLFVEKVGDNLNLRNRNC